ncbi:MAG TPA: glycosyltransferase family 39 protein [Phototrophicaceae bacterium]|nr:glycosyltransferase family 39 protein [Phototrophicaceae bacterium]
MIVVILLLGAALRLNGLHAMIGMVHYDEAYYAVDAMSLVQQPRLTPFFPDNFGRESLWMYLLAPSMAVFGGGAIPLLLMAWFTGVLTLAAVYRLARELIGGRGALSAMAGLAVLFWHVLASHEGFRALLFPLVGALTFAFLWQAQRTHRTKFWIVGGITLGLLFYTYLAARVWMALAILTLIWWFARDRRSRRGVIVAAVIAGVICVPLIVYLLTNPAAAGERIDQVAISDVGSLLNNIVVWLRVPFYQGETDVVYNLSGRPLFDLPLGVLFIGGLIGLVAVVKREKAIWLVLLAGASVAPALLTTDPLKWLRAIGLVVPIGIVLGVGAVMIERVISRVIGKGGLQTRPYKAAAIAAIPVLCIVFAGSDTLRDFNKWVNSPDLFIPMEQHIYHAIDWLAANTPAGSPVYVTPFTADHPVLRLREWELGQRPIGAFMANECLVVRTDVPAYYFNLTIYDPGFADRLGQWVTVKPVLNDDPRYAIYQASDPTHVIRAVASDGLLFGTSDQFHVKLLDALPATAHPGDTVNLQMGLTAKSSQLYTMFVHLYDQASGTIKLMSQVDQPLCPSDPPPQWSSDEVIVQPFALPIPPTLPSGDYEVAVGLYNPVTLARLPIGDTNYALLQTIHVS